MFRSSCKRSGFSGVAVQLVLFLIVSLPAHARVRSPKFPIPFRIFPLSEAITPGELSQLEIAIRAWAQKNAQALQEGTGLGDFSEIEATRVKLGTLGDGVVVSFGNRAPPCGATGNCPMALFTRGQKGYRLRIMSGGWGYAVLPSSGPVPDIAFYSNVSVGESIAASYQYDQGKFVQAPQVDCTGKNESDPTCAAENQAMETNTGVAAFSPAEYGALRRLVAANLKRRAPGRALHFPFDGAHAMNLRGINRSQLVAMTLGPCGVNRNCSISVYAHVEPGGWYWPVLSQATGWGVTGASFERGGRQVDLVIARHLSATQDELTRYAMVLPFPAAGGFPELSPGNSFLPDACEIVTPKTGRWPARWDWAALVAKPVSCLKTALPRAAQIPAADTTSVSTVVQAGGGTVWALGSGTSGLLRWRDGGWTDVASPLPSAKSWPWEEEYLRANGEVPEPSGLWVGPKGGVVVDWLDPTTQKSELFWQRGGSAKPLAVVPAAGHIETLALASFGIVAVTADAHGWRNGVPVTGQGAAIFRLSPNGELDQIYTLKTDQYLPYRTGVAGAPSFLPLSVTRDEQGHVWIWCGWIRREPNDAALAGFLVTDGKTVKYYRHIPGLPNAHLVSLDAWDHDHLVAATFGQGLYAINTTTLKASPVPEPQPGAFSFVKSVFRSGNDRYVLTFVPYVAGRMSSGAGGAVWRLRGRQWKEIAKNLPDASGAGLATADGLWLATSDFRGLWFLPASGPARRTDWRQGFPLPTANQMFQLPGGDILATDAGDLATAHSVEFRPASMLSPQRPSTAFSVVYPRSPLELDRDHHLWGILKSGVLSEWNGSRWIPHPFPPFVIASRIVSVDVDTLGREWLFPDCWLGPMGIFNPSDGRWALYRSYRIALAHSAEPVHFLHPEDDRLRPTYGPNSQIVFVGMCGAVNYFDGSSWHMWRQRLLPAPLGVLFFDAAGNLAFDGGPNVILPGVKPRLQGQSRPATWEWTPATHWHAVPYESHQIKSLSRYNPFAPLPPPPAGCTTTLPSSLVRDSTGRAWWVAGDTLYEGVPGHCRSILSGSSRQPFVGGRRIAGAILDPRGNVVLETAMPFSYVILRSYEYERR